MPPGGMGPAAGCNPVAAGRRPAESEDQRLIENRYVDEKGKPLPSMPGVSLRQAPLRRVQDDADPHEPRDGPATAAEVAGRVRQLEHAHRGQACPHPQEPGQHARFRSPAGRRADGWAARGRLPRAGRARRDSRGAADRASTATDKQESGTFDVPVEIYGVIYIYNPPDREKLGTGAASAEKPAEAAAPAAPAQPPRASRAMPAAPPPAAPPRAPPQPPQPPDA